MESIESKILYYLKKHCTGISHAISKNSLASLFSISDRELRQVKRNIVLTMDARVGSTEDGYFYAENDNEVWRFRGEYLSRIRKYNEMIYAYEKEFEKKNQGELF